MKPKIIRFALLPAGVIMFAILTLYSYNGMYIRKNMKMAMSQYKGSLFSHAYLKRSIKFK